MKRALSIFFLSLFISANFYNVVVYIIYNANKSYITEVFCVNKDKPELKCNGKCHLAKSLAAAEKEKTEKETTPSLLVFAPFLISGVDSNYPNIEQQTKTYIVKKEKKLIDKYHFYILDPPKIV
ncbi:MAG: hypothetical protein R2836_07695 [Chitinophagales bacterium]|nr:hypothetical protein [Chitinophagales bacterium]